MTAAEYVPERLDEMVKHTVQSVWENACANAAGDGQAVDEASFSSLMHSSRWAGLSCSSSRNSRAPTNSRSGTEV